ncbi:polyphosphate kinase 1 [Akkermansia sp.]|uniref:polyphosphate kinase 1 n=1 Tax=Akkermansia sp. TaxID=1872421 RepID=UPI0025BE4A35|nr:polyphosphate kinase 1 [Akkermansia sp.]
MSNEYINRELSWLEFNQRVLDQAVRTDLPLLERLKFLAITASNLDEFFMVRVGGLQMLRHSGSRVKDISGLTPTRQLKAIRARVGRMIEDQYRLFHEEILPWMEINGINPLAMEDLSTSQKLTLEQYFNNQIFPLLTPLDMDAPEAPSLPSLKLLMGVELRDNETGEVRASVVALPDGLPRRVPVPSAETERYVMLEDLVRECIGTVFPGETVLSAAVFRVTRNGDIAVQEEDALDLADEMEEVLVARKFSECVRLEIESSAPAPLHDRIMQIVGAGKEETYDLKGPLMLSDFMEMAFAPGNDQLKVEQWSPQPSPSVDPAASIFENIANGDILLNHPYESFEPVLRLVEEAAEDPDVIAIKQVLYRTAKNSRIVAALKKAAESGKQVTALVELKARFDEARNLEKAEELQRSGVQVVYGVKGLKTHAKICLVVRREQGMLRRYCHFGTGNYNETTAKIYTDISYLTCDDQLGADASQFFNSVTGRTKLMRFRKLYPSPVLMKARLIELIEGEAERARQGEPARISAKMNSLQDVEIIDALYRAADAGVDIELNVRGICCLKTGPRPNGKVIRVVSIVDRYLEHARIFFFHHGGNHQLFIASADWMTRNLDKRVELMVPVTNGRLARRLKSVLDACFKDNVQACSILLDGTSEHIVRKKGQKAFRLQQYLTKEARRLAKDKERERQQMLEPHTPH